MIRIQITYLMLSDISKLETIIGWQPTSKWKWGNINNDFFKALKINVSSSMVNVNPLWASTVHKLFHPTSMHF